MQPSFGTNAQAYRLKRVKYEGTNTIREGMALCYNHDTTTNILGSDKETGLPGITTAEGFQNEGKWKLVEEPSANNGKFFAGLVHSSKDLNNAGTGSSWVDIYTPNGAIVVAYTDRSVTIGEAAYLEIGENTVVNSGTGLGPQIGWFDETIDRSDTAGLALVKLLQPEMASNDVSSTLTLGLSPLLWADAPKNVAGRPNDGMDFFDDFDNYVDPATTKPWIITLVDTKGSIAFDSGVSGGVIQFTSATGDSADDGINAQNPLVAITPAAGTDIWFEARLKVSQADEQWAFGFAALDTTLIAVGIWDDVVDKVLFGHHTGTADKIIAINARTTVEDDHADIAAMTDDTYVTVGFKITGLTSIDYYVNGVKITGLTVTAARIPNATMLLSAVAQYEAADTILSVDWVKVQSSGGRDA